MFTIAAAETEFLDELVANTALDALTKVELVLQQVGQETIDYLRSLVDGTVEGWPDPAGPGRQPHPGGWADRSSVLAASYGFEVVRTATSITLRVFNTAEYAFWVEVMDGYFVLSGVTDPGGPVEQAFRMIAARLAPEFEVVTEPATPDGEGDAV